MRPVVAIAILAALPLSVALADVYRSVDAQGHVLYSDTPSPGAQLVRVTDAATHYNAPAPAASSIKAPPPNVTAASAREVAAQEVHSQVEQTRAEQCKKAQDYYQRMISARRVYTGATDSTGERTYMSDAEADKARVDAKLQMDDLCQGQPQQ